MRLRQFRLIFSCRSVWIRDNVLVRSDGRVLVVDFGLARSDGEREATDGPGDQRDPVDLTLTRAGAVVGTRP